MARPNVTIKTVDESMVAPIGENTSTTRGAMISQSGLITDLGNTAEKASNLMVIEDLGSWYSKLRTFAEDQLVAAGFVGATLYGAIGVSAGGYIDSNNSATRKPWHQEWWAMNNFLQYGGVGILGHTTDSMLSIIASTQVFDVMFQGGTAASYATNVATVVETKKLTDSPCLGVLFNGVTADSASMTRAAGGTDEFYVHVWGRKYHLNSFGNGTTDDSALILSNLTPDVAGCMARTDRENYAWTSPAGRRRGRILNVVRLETNPTATQQDYIYDSGINPVVTFPGEGTILFGDKTGASDTSSLSRINVSRMFIYLRKVIAPIARAVLFELNDSTTQARFRMAADGVLRGVLGAGGITDYRIICDSTNNTPANVQSRIFTADILVKPTISINFVRITFTNKNLQSDLNAGT